MKLIPDRSLHIIIWVYAAVQVFVAARLPLAAHEAHYALYAREPAASYLDHPPLAAWLQALVLQVSTADFALRLLPIGLSVLGMYGLARLTRVAYPQESVWLPVVSVLILQGTLVFHASMTLSPDGPLLPLALAAVLITLRCLEGGRPLDWLLLGLVVGLAGLAKYTAVTLALSILLLVLLRRGWRGLLPGPLWLTGGVAAVVISPVLWWNWQNDWATVAFHSDYQFEDVAGWSGSSVLRSTAEQIVYYSPLLVVGGVWALWVRWRQRGKGLFEGREGMLLAFVVPVFILYGATALASRASPHWSLLGWLLLIPVLAAWLAEAWRRRPGLRLLTWVSGSTSLAILIALPLLTVPIGTWPDYRHPARQLIGWSQASAHGTALLASLPSRGFPGESVLLARNWHHAGLLAWYAPGVPVMNLFHDLNPHNLKTGYSDASTWGVLVYPRADAEPRLADLTRDFDCSPIDALPVHFGRSLVQVFHYYACYSRMGELAPGRVVRQRG
ncbi:MAG TPA: glycosyltransferase family 39 protein [Pseudomonadales bacterium]